ncbi:MAG: hypothetical protein Q9166_004596 [cf. Caloplaca sp. 2 TL-2023]
MVYRGKEKPTLDITLTDGQQNAFIPSYTSLDGIKGNVTVTAHVETKVDHIYITFEGLVKTYVERVGATSATNGRTEGFQTFLRLVQPIEETAMPESGKVEAGKIYTFPFEFAVPEKLLPQSCNHKVDNDLVRQAHLQLPPTLGDPLTAVWGKSMMDDMAPGMSIVSYSVRARITSGRDKTGKHVIIAEENKKARVIPAVPEHPPLAVLHGKQDDYRLRKVKPIKKGTLQKKLGTLVMESAQPPALRLPPPRTENPCPVTTMATVKLRFDPASSDAQPPRLGSLATKLKVATFFGSDPVQEIPIRSGDFHCSPNKGIYVESVPLSSRCVASATWKKHTAPSTPPHQDFTVPDLCNLSVSNPTTPAPSDAYKEGRGFYTAHLLVPITLPGKADGNTTNKIFVPTFHNCLISRVYALDLSLSCHTPGTSVTDPVMHLKLPIQISSEPSADAQPNISEGEAEAIARREAADFAWHPRNVAPPSPEYTEQAQLDGTLPPSPDYAECTARRESRGPGPVYSGPVGRRLSGVAFETSLGLPPPNYTIQTSGRPNVRSVSTF